MFLDRRRLAAAAVAAAVLEIPIYVEEKKYLKFSFSELLPAEVRSDGDESPPSSLPSSRVRLSGTLSTDDVVAAADDRSLMLVGDGRSF